MIYKLTPPSIGQHQNLSNEINPGVLENSLQPRLPQWSQKAQQLGRLAKKSKINQ